MSRGLRTRVLRRLVPHGRRPRLRALYNRATWFFYIGRAVQCNCCGGHFRRFRSYVGVGNHHAQMCPRCGSLGRHRVDWLYITTVDGLLQGPIRLLHIAPEVCLARPLRSRPNIEYRSADYDSTLAMDRIDIRDMPYADASFDAIVCNHVLSFIDDDVTAMSELHRVLKPGGWAMLQSPIDMARATIDRVGPQVTEATNGRYEEHFKHLYGRDYADRLEQAGFAVTNSGFVAELTQHEQNRLGLDPDETIFLCRRVPAASHSTADSALVAAGGSAPT